MTDNVLHHQICLGWGLPWAIQPANDQDQSCHHAVVSACMRPVQGMDILCNSPSVVSSPVMFLWMQPDSFRVFTRATCQSEMRCYNVIMTVLVETIDQNCQLATRRWIETAMWNETLFGVKYFQFASYIWWKYIFIIYMLYDDYSIYSRLACSDRFS